MNAFLEKLKNEVVIADGAMGTLLLDAGVRPGGPLELLNVTNPELIRSIHSSYVQAGAQVIETNNFGGNRIKLSESGLSGRTGELNAAGVKLAKEAARGLAYVAGNIGPTGKLLEPMGDLPFDAAYEAFLEQAGMMEEAGADLIIVETMTDIKELKAAVMAAKEATKLPVVASMTFEDNGITVTGTPPEAFVLVAESAGADVIGANCSNGPRILLPVMEKIAKHSTVPLVVMPNAGFPVVEGGRAVYKMSPEEFASHAERFLKMGVNMVGGCCGTRPEHIKAVKDMAASTKRQVPRKIIPLSGLASRTRFISYDRVLVIGERINPTGRPKLQEEIRSGKMSIIKAEAQAQEKAGADLIDVNVSVPQADDVSSIGWAVGAVSTATSASISIDSPRVQVLEAGLKAFPGKALVNSTTGKSSSLEKVLPLVKRYGAAVIGLCFDDAGIPDSARGRFDVAKKIVARAVELGIPKEDIFIDTLVMTAGVGVQQSLATIEAAKMVKEKLGVKVALGISNVSHGLPERGRLNGVYLELALSIGADAVIIDPTDKNMMKIISEAGSKLQAPSPNIAAGLVRKFEKEASKWKGVKGQGTRVKGQEEKSIKPSLEGVKDAVIDGDQDMARSLAEGLLKEGTDPQRLVDEALVPAMDVVGKRFRGGEYYLPQVIASAEAMKAGFELARERLKDRKAKPKGKVVLATVRGDVHDIGKNIVKMMLENNGLEVVDLGKDVAPEKILDAVRSSKANAVALSALLTTTMLEMKEVRDQLLASGINIPVIIGGAVVTEDFAKSIGASYGRDAVKAVDIAKKILQNA